jgi:hypothetical protein
MRREGGRVIRVSPFLPRPIEEEGKETCRAPIAGTSTVHNCNDRIGHEQGEYIRERRIGVVLAETEVEHVDFHQADEEDESDERPRKEGVAASSVFPSGHEGGIARECLPDVVRKTQRPDTKVVKEDQEKVRHEEAGGGTKAVPENRVDGPQAGNLAEEGESECEGVKLVSLEIEKAGVGIPCVTEGRGPRVEQECPAGVGYLEVSTPLVKL